MGEKFPNSIRPHTGSCYTQLVTSSDDQCVFILSEMEDSRSVTLVCYYIRSILEELAACKWTVESVPTEINTDGPKI